MGDWQSIETAPKNGSALLLWLSKPLSSNDVEGYVPWDEIQSVIGWWSDSFGVNEPEGHWQLAFMFEGSGDSEGYTSHFYIEIPAGGATHWMPLPVRKP